MAVTSRLGVYGNMGSTSSVPGTEPGGGVCCAGCCANVRAAIKEVKQNESANCLELTMVLRRNSQNSRGGRRQSGSGPVAFWPAAVTRGCNVEGECYLLMSSLASRRLIRLSTLGFPTSGAP